MLSHSRKKLRSRIGDIVSHSVGKSCPALSSEPGLILLTAQVVRGSVGLGFVTLVVHPLGGTFGGRETCDEFLGWPLRVGTLGYPQKRRRRRACQGGESCVLRSKLDSRVTKNANQTWLFLREPLVNRNVLSLVWADAISGCTHMGLSSPQLSRARSG